MAPDDRTVVDLSQVERTRIRVERDHDPLARLSEQDRTRLIVRVLCELVAYGEPLHDERTDRAAS